MPGVQVGTVTGLWRYPVKSMLGEALDESEVGEHGLAGDRAYALLDVRTGRVISAKNPKRWPLMFQLRAAYRSPPKPGRPLPPVRIEFPDGDTVDSEGGEADLRLSRFLGGGGRPLPRPPGPPARRGVHPPNPGAGGGVGG